MIEIVLFLMIIFIVINTIYVIFYKTIRNFCCVLEIKRETSKFNREINVIYSPSIVSYLYNQKIEVKKDLVSDILNLYARKIIDIKSIDEENYEIILNKKIYEEAYLSYNLMENDRYIIDTIITKRFDFKYEEWQKKVKKVYKEQILKEENTGEKIIERFIDNNQIFFCLGIPAIFVFIFVLLCIITR